MQFRVISRADILSLITMHDAIEAMARGFGQLSAGDVEMPVRVVLTSGDGFSLFMPSRMGATGDRGAKIASLFPGNRDKGLATINGVILMIDDETGLPAAMMDAGELTAIRTAAAAGLAARLLSRSDCRVLTIFGAGAQAPWQIEAIRAVRPIEEVRVVSRGGESARRLAASLEGVEATALSDAAEAVDGADIIVAVTTAGTPVFDGSGLPAGTHVSGSGSFQPHTREVGDEVVTRARVVVEERECALEEAGDLVIPIEQGLVTADVIDADLGEIVNGDAPEGNAGRELTFFKSVGTAVQDVAIGADVLRRAEEEGVGQMVGL